MVGYRFRLGIVAAAVVMLVSCTDDADEGALRDRDATEEQSTTTAGDTSTTTTTKTTVASDVTRWDGDDGFYTVRSNQPQGCPPDAERRLSLVNGTDGTCYDLNLDTGLDADVVESAEAELDEQLGTFQVALVFTRDGIELFNQLASVCFSATEVCPTRQVAFVANGLVVWAPVIQLAAYERDAIVISVARGMSETEARDVADALDS